MYFLYLIEYCERRFWRFSSISIWLSEISVFSRELIALRVFSRSDASDWKAVVEDKDWVGRGESIVDREEEEFVLDSCSNTPFGLQSSRLSSGP